MKTTKHLTILLLLLVSTSTISQTLNKGFVKYEMISDDEDMAMIGAITMINYFDENQSAVEINMMGGLMITKVYTKYSNPNDLIMTMDAMGQKYEITEIEDKDAKGNAFGQLDNIESVKYDKKDTKEISGYKCHKAEIKYSDGKTAVFYITNKISQKAMQNPNQKVQLEGYPLEMEITSEEGIVKIIATEVSKNLPSGSFIVPSGFEKVTMEEFQQKMGG